MTSKIFLMISKGTEILTKNIIQETVVPDFIV